MPSSFPVVVQHWLLGQQVLFNRTRMECFLSLAIWSADLPHICYSSKVRGTCRSCIVMEARAWITLSTMRASKNTRYLSINIWLSWLTFVLIILVLPQEVDTVAVMIAAPFAESTIYHRPKPDEPTTYQRHLVWVSAVYNVTSAFSCWRVLTVYSSVRKFA